MGLRAADRGRARADAAARRLARGRARPRAVPRRLRLGERARRSAGGREVHHARRDARRADGCAAAGPPRHDESRDRMTAPEASARPLLELRGVTKSFGGLTCVYDLDLAVAEREIVSLIGPNGAGKTTVFNLVTGVYRPDRGDILLDGGSLVGLAPHVITTLG